MELGILTQTTNNSVKDLEETKGTNKNKEKVAAEQSEDDDDDGEDSDSGSRRRDWANDIPTAGAASGNATKTPPASQASQPPPGKSSTFTIPKKPKQKPDLAPELLPLEGIPIEKDTRYHRRG